MQRIYNVGKFPVYNFCQYDSAIICFNILMAKNCQANLNGSRFIVIPQFSVKQGSYFPSLQSTNILYEFHICIVLIIKPKYNNDIGIKQFFGCLRRKLAITEQPDVAYFFNGFDSHLKTLYFEKKQALNVWKEGNLSPSMY